MLVIMNSRDLRTCSKVCSEHIINWQYPSLGDLEEKFVFQKLILRSGSAWTFSYGHLTYKMKMKEIFWINKLAFLKEGKYIFLSTFGVIVHKV